MIRTVSILLLAALAVAGQEYKIAVVGLGHAHVGNHLSRMVKNEHARLVGVADSVAALRESARKRGVPETLIFSDYARLLDEAKPDIVWTFSETYRHLEIVKACAARKIHVMMEKPLSATYAQALEIRRLARKHGIHVMTNYGSTWRPAIYTAKALVESGAVGPVFRIRKVTGHGGPGDPKTSYFASWLADPEKNGGGALVDFGCYNVLHSLWLKGRPESVYATAHHLQPERYPKVDDHATIVLNYQDGTAIFEQSWSLPARAPEDLEIFGRKGSLYVASDTLKKWTGKTSEDVKVDPLPPERADPVAYVVNLLRKGTAPDGMSGLDINVDVMELLEAAKQSIKSGRAVRLPLSK